MTIKSLFEHYLSRLEHIVDILPENVFEQALREDMFCLAVQAKIATNFILRGYCPLIGEKTMAFDQADNSKSTVMKQINQTTEFLQTLPDVETLDHGIKLSDKAGFTMVTLPQPEFIHHYILPNFFFHLSMVYAIARASGVELSKGDLDGLHQYPTGFSFQ